MCADEEDLLAAAKHDWAGELCAVRFDWHKRGNRVHKEWDNTVLGNLAIDAHKLVVDVNSAERARTIRAEVEKRLGERVVFRVAATQSIEQQLAAQRADPRARKRDEETERLNSLPEVQEHLRALYTQHWERWVDEQIPALQGATPREAAATAEGRERLEALLAQFEWQERRAASPPPGPGVAELRARLGM